MSDTTAPAPISPFERIRHQDDAGDYWLARELAALVGYKWRNFEQVVKKAMTACANSGRQVPDHFTDVSNMIATGKGAKRTISDYHL